MKVRIFITLMVAGFFLLISCQKKVGTVKLNNDIDTISYCLGVNIGANLLKTEMQEINYKALAKGIQDIYTNEEPIFDPVEANNRVNDFLYKLETLKYMDNLEEGRKFLEKNKTRKDVVTLPSSLQYRIISEGTGPKPKLTDIVTVNYRGSLINGNVFDSTEGRGEPAIFRVNEMIPGWQEALQLMPVGSKWEVFIPARLAYSMRPPPGSIIEPNHILIFEIELLSIAGNEN